MRVLIACEESQAVCKAFRELGHEAYSCDIQDCSGGHPEWHIKGDVLAQLDKGWDLMVAHPPCTHIAVSGAAHFAKKRADGRQQEAIDFFMALINAPIPKIAVENPVCIMSSVYRKPDQVIQPYEYGDKASKKTCLWLKGLPKLVPTNIVEPEYIITSKGTKYDKWWYETCLIPLKYRGKARSKTFMGIAKAMAEQWGSDE